MVKELYNKLPGSWSEFKLKDYLKTLPIQISENEKIGEVDISETENTIKILSVLLDVSTDILESMPLSEITYLAGKIKFISTMPEVLKKPVLQLKKLEEVTYGNFVDFISFQKNPFQNMPAIIKAFSKNELTEDNILNLGMDEIYTAFFLLKKYVQKLMKATFLKTIMQYVKIQFKTIINRLFSRIKLKLFKK